MNSLPGLPGNPHADALKLHQDFGNTLSPSVQATLALAFEQRTANRINAMRLQSDYAIARMRMKVEAAEAIDQRLGLSDKEANNG